MKYTRFIISEFKGIESATIDLIPGGANVFTLIGLNESGKTTVLEAIGSFAIEKENIEVLYGAISGDTIPISLPSPSVD